MPVVLSHNETLELNLAEYSGAISLDELKALAQFMAKNPDDLRRDTLTILLPSAHLRDVDLNALDALFSRYRTMYAPLDFQIVRRSAWICQSEAALGHARRWVDDGRETAREEMSSLVRLFDDYATAGEWLLLSTDEIAAVERREGFVELARLDLPTRAAGPAR